MPIKLIIQGTTYEYPIPGEDPNWGEGAVDWAEGVTSALNTLIGPGDILQSTFAINNNVTIATNVNGLLFDPGTVRASNISYTIYRTSTSNLSGNTESGTIFINYDDNASPGNKWSSTQQVNGSSGVVFSILDSGQVQYVSNDIGNPGYFGKITFSAKSLTR
jgi:hypothetical protein